MRPLLEKKMLNENSRECHNHDTKRARKDNNNACKKNRSINTSSLVPNRGDRSTKRDWKHNIKNKDQGKTRHERPRSKKHKNTHNKILQRTLFKAFLLSTNLHPGP